MTPSSLPHLPSHFTVSLCPVTEQMIDLIWAKCVLADRQVPSSNHGKLAQAESHCKASLNKMARCTGGPSSGGEQRRGRMHMDGDEENCVKHQSDNFSLLSTTSRVAARNRYAAFPPVHPEGGIEDGSEGRHDTASSTTTRVPESVLRPHSPDSISEDGFSVSSFTSQNSIAINAVLPHIPYELPVPVLIAPAVRPPDGIRGAEQQAGLHRRRNTTFRYLKPTMLSLVVIAIYACYRYTFREDFQYQDEVIRAHFGLPNR